MNSLRAMKRAATAREYQRVYDCMCLPARDITVEFEGCVYVRRAWNSLRGFGWTRWEVANG